MSNNNNAINEIITITQGDIPEVVKDHSDRMRWALKTVGHRRGLTMPLFVSMPGVGKSETGTALAAALGRKDYDLRAGNFIPSDIRLPMIDAEAKVAHYAGNSELPFIQKGGCSKEDSVMLKWEEFLDASLPVMRIMKQGTNDNCIGNCYFPDDTLHVGFANGLNHGCQSERMPASSANRTAFYEVSPSVDAYQKWLESHSLYPELEVVVSNNLDIFYDVDFSRWDGKSNFASFRSVTEVGMLFASKYVTEVGGKRKFSVQGDRLLSARLNALVGYKAAKKIETFLTIFEAVGSIQNLLDDPTGCKIPTDPSTKWVIACKLTGEADEANLPAVMKVASRLMGEKSFMESYIGRTIAKQKPSLNFHPTLQAWRGDNVLELCGRD